MDIKEITRRILPSLRAYPISYAGIFGSYARGDSTEASDIDLLIRYNKPIDLFDLGSLTNSLEEATGKRVDVVIEKTVQPLMMKYIRRDLQTVYE